MSKFTFEAKDVRGRMFKGELEAASESEARIKLRAQKLMPVRVNRVEQKVSMAKKVGGRRVSAKELQIFTRQLATLLGSGIPILQSLEILSQSQKSAALSVAIKSMVSDINQGRRFGEAMAEHPFVFDRFYVNMVKAGEESGNIDAILNRLAQYIEKSVKIQGQIKGAMVYPAAILVVAGLVVAGLLVFVIPKFESVFASSGQELPGLTKMVVAMSKGFMSYWWMVLGGIMGLVFLIINYYRTEDGKRTIDGIVIDVPLMGDLIQKAAIARFTRTLATLLSSGVSIMEALEIASKVAGNTVIELALLRAREAISEGKSLTVPLMKEKYIPQMVTQMIGVGEQTGAIDQMLNKVADFYEDEVDVAVAALTSALEPMMMVVLGGIVAFLVVAMYLPIFNMAGSVA
ncbi:MAG: type II secretion system F family protein [Bdellovibrionales bacterium]|jgi:type IV pilus assembly protein PilC|nr:type II secretion system F family protein [Bdellovibrionales bacterium]